MRLTRLNQIVKDGRTVNGSWKLTRKHELRYLRDGAQERVVVSGPLAGGDARGIRFRVEAGAEEGEPAGRELELTGRWETDSKNRLVFVAAGAGGREDRLRLEGRWEIGPDHQLLYRFDRENLKTKRKESHAVRFQGAWQIGEDRRLTYTLERTPGSEFRFRGSFQSDSILAKRGEIRYQLGGELKGKGRPQVIALFGKWKISRRLALSFEIPYRDGKVRGIDFGADFGFTKGGRLSCRLLTREGKSLGAELLFTRDFLGGEGELFARLRRMEEETAVEGGVRLRW